MHKLGQCVSIKCFFSCENNINLSRQNCYCFFFCGFKRIPVRWLPSAFVTSYFHSDWFEPISRISDLKSQLYSSSSNHCESLSPIVVFISFVLQCVWWPARDFLGSWVTEAQQSSHTEQVALNWNTESKSHLLCHSFIQSGVCSSTYFDDYSNKSGDRGPGSFTFCPRESSGGFLQRCKKHG